MAPELMIVKANPNQTHWSMEDGYKSDCERGYPIRVFNVKHSVALTIFLQVISGDVEYRCKGLIPVRYIYSYYCILYKLCICIVGF